MGHFYTPEGEPAYTVPKKTGEGERSTNIRDARELGLQPSVTEILGILDKPALTRWLVDQAVAKATGKEWIDGKKKAEEGTRIHDAVEAHFNGEKYPKKYTKHVEATLKALKDTYPDVDDWVAEASFSTGKGGYGGKVDLHSPKHSIVVDFKTKDFDEESADKVKCYDEHYMQLGAYSDGLELAAYRGANLFISRDNPGVVKMIKHEDGELMRGYAMFGYLCDFWYYQKRYPLDD